MQELIQYLSDNKELANALAAIAGVVVAAIACIVSFASLYFSIKALKYQRHHNKLSVTPIPEVTVADYENSIRVKLRNNGSGPIIVKSVSVINGKESRASLIEWMPALPNNRHWTTFSHSLVNRSLLPGSELILLELTACASETGFAKCREKCRLALSVLIVEVDFTDVYKSAFLKYSKSLDWFGRH